MRRMIKTHRVWGRQTRGPLAGLVIAVAMLGSVASVRAAGGRFANPKPAVLVDLAQIKALTLADLGWQEDRRELIGNVLVLGGSWIGPHFAGYDVDWQEVEIDLTEYATVYLPVGQPLGTVISQVVRAVHTEPSARNECGGCRTMAEGLPAAFINHGEKAQRRQARQALG